MEGKFVKISAEKYLELLKKADEFDSLDAAGVDNWEGYGEHCEYMIDEDELIEEVNSKLIE